MLDSNTIIFAEIQVNTPVRGVEQEQVKMIGVAASSQHVMIHVYACLHVATKMMQRADAQVSCRAKSVVKKMIQAASATI